MVAFDLAGLNEAKSAPEYSPGRNSSQLPPISAAQAEFAKSNWPAAILNYRKHLRVVPNDFRAWGQLGIAYYNSGQIKDALATFHRVEKSTPDKSLNYFYQGMCVAILGSERDAQKYWEYATNWTDEFGARATFELATSNYRESDLPKARQWFSTYIQKYPRGPDAANAKEHLKSIADGKKFDSIKGFDRPDQDASLYRYHPWSLFQFPHFWEIQTGVKSVETVGYQPGPLEPGSRFGTIERRNEQNTDILLNASIGVGPVRKDNNTSFAGYTYRQNWLTQPDSLQTWVTSGFDMDAFPIRGDLMERTHLFFGDVRRQISQNLFAGAYSRLSFSRIGSSFFPSPDEESLRVVTSHIDTQLVIPWIGWSWNATNRSMASLYLRKEIHNQSPEHSNKTYNLESSGGMPSLSFTLSHGMEFPSKRVELSFDLFQYSFIYNDLFLDYTRRGALASADYNIWKGIGTSLILGMYQDSYDLPAIKTGTCSGTSDEEKPKPVACTRTDSGNMIQITVYYEKSQNLRFDASYLMVENSSNQKVYSDSKNTILATATWAFPGTRRVAKMTRRFADAAFTKDSEE